MGAGGSEGTQEVRQLGDLWCIAIYSCGGWRRTPSSRALMFIVMPAMWQAMLLEGVISNATSDQNSSPEDAVDAITARLTAIGANSHQQNITGSGSAQRIGFDCAD